MPRTLPLSRTVLIGKQSRSEIEVKRVRIRAGSGGQGKPKGGGGCVSVRKETLADWKSSRELSESTTWKGQRGRHGQASVPVCGDTGNMEKKTWLTN